MAAIVDARPQEVIKPVRRRFSDRDVAVVAQIEQGITLCRDGEAIGGAFSRGIEVDVFSLQEIDVDAMGIDGAISIDATSWLGDWNIPLVKINWRGNVVSVAGGSEFALDRKKIDGQLKAQRNGAGFKLAVKAITQKVANSAETLRNGLPPSTGIERAIEKVDDVEAQRARTPPRSLDQLLGMEWRAGRVYFNAWKGAPINRAQTSKWPVPEEWKSIGPRLS